MEDGILFAEEANQSMLRQIAAAHKYSRTRHDRPGSSKLFNRYEHVREIAAVTKDDVTKQYVKQVGMPWKDILVMYYSSADPGCQRFLYGTGTAAAPQQDSEYRKLVGVLENDPSFHKVRLLRVDLQRHPELTSEIASSEHVTSYPTFKLFKALPKGVAGKYKANWTAARDAKGPGLEYKGAREAAALKQFVVDHCTTCRAGPAHRLDADVMAAEGDAHGHGAHDGGGDGGASGAVAYAYDGADEALLGADGAEDGQVEELSLYDNSTAVHPEIKAPIEGMDEAGNEFI